MFVLTNYICTQIKLSTVSLLLVGYLIIVIGNVTNFIEPNIINNDVLTFILTTILLVI